MLEKSFIDALAYIIDMCMCIYIFLLKSSDEP